MDATEFTMFTYIRSIIAGSVTKLKEGCFGPRSDAEYLLIRKRCLVLAATIQLSLNAHSLVRRSIERALSLALSLASYVT